MNLEGKTCGNCLEGKLHRFQDEVEPGIFVEAYQCPRCNSIEYTEAVMKRVEAMYRESAHKRSLIKVGASLAFCIPHEIVKKLRLKPKEKVYVMHRGNEIIARVTPA